ncbi:MAG: hypothetical protein J6Y91_06145 [Alphaproteobacteria bacterium]|nr:hypothetical protein [Alphaproteobacteria bacterium]
MCSETIEFDRCKEHDAVCSFDGDENVFVYVSKVEKICLEKQHYQQNIQFHLYLDCTLTASGEPMLIHR